MKTRFWRSRDESKGRRLRAAGAGDQGREDAEERGRVGARTPQKRRRSEHRGRDTCRPLGVQGAQLLLGGLAAEAVRAQSERPGGGRDRQEERRCVQGGHRLQRASVVVCVRFRRGHEKTATGLADWGCGLRQAVERPSGDGAGTDLRRQVLQGGHSGAVVGGRFFDAHLPRSRVSAAGCGESAAQDTREACSVRSRGRDERQSVDQRERSGACFESDEGDSIFRMSANAQRQNAITMLVFRNRMCTLKFHKYITFVCFFIEMKLILIDYASNRLNFRPGFVELSQVI